MILTAPDPDGNAQFQRPTTGRLVDRHFAPGAGTLEVRQSTADHVLPGSIARSDLGITLTPERDGRR